MQTKDLWVGDRIVRPALGEIELGLERIRVEPRSMEVLLALCRHAPDLVSKEELMREVWGDSYVTEEVLPHAIWDLRRALGDDASNPEFIQTVPKRGYMLIAPVSEVEPRVAAGGGTARRRLGWSIVSGAVLAISLAAAAVWILAPAPRPAPVPGSGSERPLVLVPTDAPAGASGLAEMLDSRLRSLLVGTPEVDLMPLESCAKAATLGQALCLEPFVETAAAGHAARAQLTRTPSGRLAYATPPIELTGAAGLSPAAEEIAELVRAYFEIERDPFAHDPDIRPWFDLARHDPRAIRDFLLAIDFVYRHEVGSAKAHRAAIRRDPDFVAPRVFHTPAVIDGGDAEEQAAHREGLERLYDDATSFEKAMLEWAVAAIDGDRSVQIRQLEVALEQEPGNRPITLLLGFTYLAEGSLDLAWERLAPLVEQRWYYPGLYGVAGRCALLRGRIDQAREVLAVEIPGRPVDAVVLELRRLLAIYDGDDEAAARYAKRLEQRLREMQPEVVELQTETYAGILAAAAERQGRHAAARRLRESAA